MYGKIMPLIMTVVLTATMAGCSTQQVTADMSSDEGTAAAEPVNEKQEYTSAEIKDENSLLNEEQTQLLYDFALCYADTLKNMQPADFKP